MQRDVFTEAFRSNFCAKLMDKIYEHTDRIFRKQVDEISLAHARIVQKPNCGFIYNNLIFSPTFIEGTHYPGHLHASLHNDMATALARKELVPHEQEKVKSFFNRLLNTVRTPQDLLVLLPQSVKDLQHTAIVEIESLDFDGGIDPKVLAEFKEKNQEFYSLIDQRIMLNMVLK